MVKEHSDYQQLSEGLQCLDEHGFPKMDKDLPNYFGLFLAYSGLRSNNLLVYLDAFRNFSIENVKSIIPKTVKVDKCSHLECMEKN